MTINSYLTSLANRAILRDDEKTGVRRSIATLESRLKAHFGTGLKSSFIFGSYSRGTILPRFMDRRSDIDYMTIFSDSSLQPQTYLDRLRRFAERYYGRSEIAQSHPTVALELNHIGFELVPAIEHWWNGLQIPAKASSYVSWQDTDPKGFNERLIGANRANKNLIKPLVRLVKYWNATARYPFESYALEQHVAGQGYSFFGLLSPWQLGDYFVQAVESLDAGWAAPQWKQESLSRLKQLTSLAQSQDRSGNPGQAEELIKRLLPPVGGLLGI
jgi:predicted nucleotidyltransferase